MNKKYYDGFNVIDILFKNLEPRKMLKVLNAFAESDGVDAVEVVRCKECKRNKSDKWVDCPITEMYGRTTDNYCSMAERRQDDKRT